MMNQQRREKLRESFAQAVAAAKELDIVEQEEALDSIYTLLFNEAWLFSIHEMPSDFVQQLYAERPQACSLSAQVKKNLCLPLNAEELAELQKLYKDVPVVNHTDADIDEERKCKQRFSATDDKMSFIECIINDKSIPALKRAELVWYCTDTVFSPLYYEIPLTWFNKDTIDWVLMKRILSVEEDFLIGDEVHCGTDDEHTDLEMYVEQNRVNQVIVSAALGEIEAYEANMDILMNDIRYNVSRYLEQNAHWSNLVNLRNYSNITLYYARNSLTNIGKASWILPYLIRFATDWKAYTENKKLSDESAFFSIYSAIVECADNAYLEEDVPPQYQMDYLDISIRYQKYMDEITGTTYTFRPKEE